jgi:hypothetical protein
MPPAHTAASNSLPKQHDIPLSMGPQNQRQSHLPRPFTMNRTRHRHLSPNPMEVRVTDRPRGDSYCFADRRPSRPIYPRSGRFCPAPWVRRGSGTPPSRPWCRPGRAMRIILGATAVTMHLAPATRLGPPQHWGAGHPPQVGRVPSLAPARHRSPAIGASGEERKKVKSRQTNLLFARNPLTRNPLTRNSRTPYPCQSAPPSRRYPFPAPHSHATVRPDAHEGRERCGGGG